MFRKRKSNNSAGKINHKITIVDGIKFHSKMESRYYEYLKDLKANGIVKDFVLQKKFLLQDKFIVIDGKSIPSSDVNFNKLKKLHKAETIRAINYICDFEVTYTDGHVEVIDTKGKSTADFEIKRKMLMFKYPDIIFKVIIEDSKSKEWVDYYSYQKAKKAKKVGSK